MGHSKMRGSARRCLGAAAFCCAFILVLSPVACSRNRSAEHNSGQSAETAAKPVQVAAIRRNDRSREFSLTGITRASSRAKLAFQVSGQLVARPVHIGSVVKKGELLAQISQPDMGPATQAAAADVRQSRTQLAQAERDLARTRTLVQQDADTPQALEDAQMRRDSLAAQLDSARAQSARATGNAGELKLNAPIAGSVEQVYFEPGEFVPAGQPVVALSGGTALEVEIGVPEGLITAIHQGQPAHLTLPFFNDRAINGTVLRIAQAGGGPGQLFQAVIRLDDTANLRAGLSVEWHVNAPASGGLLVPTRAIASPGPAGQPSVYVIRRGHALAVPVQLGDVVGESVLVDAASGHALTAGEPVITVGLNNLADGRAVQIVPTADDNSPTTRPADGSDSRRP